MDCSPARIAANRLNARKSSGPRTQGGKDRSRLNSYRHGMAGEGVALPEADEAEVARVFASIEAEFAPESDVDRSLVRRVALLTARLDRCAANDASEAAARVLTAEGDFDEARLAEVDRLMLGLDHDPAGSVRLLRRTGEGVDRLVATWRALRADLACAAMDRWTERHWQMAEALVGRKAGEIGISRVEVLARAIAGDFRLTEPGEAIGHDEATWLGWARGEMIGLIDAEIAALLAHRSTLDPDLTARLRALAPDRALFDPSKPAQLARRYEAAAERGLYRALRELRDRGLAESLPAPPPPPVPAPEPPPAPEPADPVAPLGSFRQDEPADLAPAPDTPKRRPDLARRRPTPPSRRDRTAEITPRDASTLVIGRA